MLFAGGYTLLVRRTICLLTHFYKYSYSILFFYLVNGAIGGFIGGATLVLEPSGRQAEIALFCVNKTI